MRLKRIFRMEILLATWALFPGVVYFFLDDAGKALRVFLVCFIVPQPFLLWALRREIFRRH